MKNSTEESLRWLFVTDDKWKVLMGSKPSFLVYFSYLRNLIQEDVFSVCNRDERHYKERTMCFPCTVDSVSAELCLMISPRIVNKCGELGITREVYVAISNEGSQSIEDWGSCLSALFAFIFSADIWVAETWHISEGKKTVAPYVQTGVPEDIERTGQDYSRLYRQIIHEFPVVCDMWATKWFAHGAYQFGLYKYLDAMKRQENIPVEFQIAIISEAFLHYSDTRYKGKESAENAIGYQYRKLYENGGVQIDDEDALKKLVRFYGNYKHFSETTRGPRILVDATVNERVAFSNLARSLFQLSVLYDLVGHNEKAFQDMYLDIAKIGNALMSGTVQYIF